MTVCSVGLDDPDFCLPATLFDIGEIPAVRMPADQGRLGNAERYADQTIFVEACALDVARVIDHTRWDAAICWNQDKCRAEAVRRRVRLAKLKRDHVAVRGQLYRCAIQRNAAKIA